MKLHGALSWPEHKAKMYSYKMVFKTSACCSKIMQKMRCSSLSRQYVDSESFHQLNGAKKKNPELVILVTQRFRSMLCCLCDYISFSKTKSMYLVLQIACFYHGATEITLKMCKSVMNLKTKWMKEETL